MEDRVEKLEQDVGAIRKDVDAVKKAQEAHLETVGKIHTRLERVWDVRRDDKEAAKQDNDRRQGDIMDGFASLNDAVEVVRADVAENQKFITGARAVQKFVDRQTGEFTTNPMLSPQMQVRAKRAGLVGIVGTLLAALVYGIDLLTEIREALASIIPQLP